jgi:hypothetical protein
MLALAYKLIGLPQLIDAVNDIKTRDLKLNE